MVINLCGPFSPSNQYRFIFTAIDPYTKFFTSVGIRNKEALTIAKVLIKHVFLIWAGYFEILSDLGTKFENEIVREVCNLLAIHKNAVADIVRKHRALLTSGIKFCTL